jgi:hypothetical protein
MASAPAARVRSNSRPKERQPGLHGAARPTNHSVVFLVKKHYRELGEEDRLHVRQTPDTELHLDAYDG